MGARDGSGASQCESGIGVDVCGVCGWNGKVAISVDIHLMEEGEIGIIQF
jgi:hypothetical protein